MILTCKCDIISWIKVGFAMSLVWMGQRLLNQQESVVCPHKYSVTNASAVCMWWDCVPMPMEVRSLAHRGCVFVFACMWVCVLVGTGPSVSGKHCHCYINKPDRGDRHGVGELFVG